MLEQIARARAALIAAAVLSLAVAAPAAAARYAPPGRSGPPLSVHHAALVRSLRCTHDVASARREPILLVPGTTLTPDVNFSWNYERAFRARHLPFCSVTLPNHAMSDIQVSAEYVVYALRRMHTLSRRKVNVVGFSQGGMVPRWALRFWPRLRAVVDDDIGLDASNHGTLDAYPACTFGCAAAFYQQQSGSAFTRALNSYSETFRGISYTEIFSRTDEVVVPNLDARGSSSVHGGRGAITNVAVQDVCPGDASDHLAMGTYDAVGYALVLDAISHRGPARPARVPRSVCAQPLAPGVDPRTFPTDYAHYLAVIANVVATYPRASREPPLKCYVVASCRRPRRA